MAAFAFLGLLLSGCGVSVSTRNIDYERGTVEVVATQHPAGVEAPGLDPSEDSISVARAGCSKIGTDLEPALANVTKSYVGSGIDRLMRMTYTFRCVEP